jgi:D-aminopeptidase
VRVGHVTRWSDGAEGVARTGVTAIVPDDLAPLYVRPMAAGPAVLNGCGELTGSIAMAEWGTLDSPIMLTSTTAIGRVFDAVVDATFEAVPSEVDDEVIPVPIVGECDDSWLDDARRRHVTLADARAALDHAVTGPVAEGVVGAGTGMITMEHKAGIGTSSRVLEGVGVVGVLVLANFGRAEQLRIAGAPVGNRLEGGSDPTASARGDAGSCIGVVATDIPLDARQLVRVARRVGLGLARMGSVAGHHSGEIFCAFSTTNRRNRVAEGVMSVDLLGDDSIGSLFQATVDATEEAVCNALFVADTVVGRDGNVAPCLPLERILD